MRKHQLDVAFPGIRALAPVHRGAVDAPRTRPATDVPAPAPPQRARSGTVARIYIPPGRPEVPPSVTAEDIEAFVACILDPTHADAGEAMVDRLIEGGATADELYLDLLTPAARTLGEMWYQDTCDFLDVTISLGRMQRILRNLSSRLHAGPPQGRPVGRILLTTVPGEQHTLGLFMVAEFFVRASWYVRVGAPVTAADFVGMIADEQFDVIGFSTACDSRLPGLTREIRRARRRSANRDVAILVGGRVFDQNPSLVARVGADLSVQDPRDAPGIAASLLPKDVQ